jgi:hypothetical protein
MRIGGIVVEKRHVAHVHVRIDQSWYEKSAAPVDSTGVRTGNEIRADFNNPAISDNDIRMEQRGSAFRRDQSDIFDHCALMNNSLRVSGGPNIENDQRSQYSDKQSITQDSAPSYPDVRCDLKIIRTFRPQSSVRSPCATRLHSPGRTRQERDTRPLMS